MCMMELMTRTDSRTMMSPGDEMENRDPFRHANLSPLIWMARLSPGALLHRPPVYHQPRGVAVSG
jgi:hypothetical protein